MPAGYEHTQRAPLWMLLALAVGLLSVGAAIVDEVPVRVALTALVVCLAVLAFAFMYLRVRDCGEFLSVRFGPLPLCGTRVLYGDIESVRVARSRLIDGWGIHWMPGRGWTYNLWGFACVELRLARGVLRVGTDDPEGLAAFLATRVGLRADAPR